MVKGPDGVLLDSRNGCVYPFESNFSELEESYGKPDKFMLKAAARRIRQAVLNERYEHGDVSFDSVLYVAAAMILGSIRDAKITGAFVRHDVNMYANEAVKSDSFELVEFADRRYGLGVERGDCLRVSLVGYLKCVTKRPGWDLAEHGLLNGTVRVSFLELNELAANAVRKEIVRKFSSVSYGGELPEGAMSIITGALKRKRDMFKIMSDAVPPCMEHCKATLAGGGHLTYNGRLALAAFCGKRGMEKGDIVRLFENSPDFKESVTTSQVTGILDKDLMPYSCEKMEMYGLCRRHDRCGNIVNPLSYR